MRSARTAQISRLLWQASAALYLVLIASNVACRHQAETSSRRYHLKGTVVTVSVDNGLLVVSHEEIPGFMGAMTMGYAVRDHQALVGLYPGDEITADVVVQSNDSWLENIVVVKKAASPPQALAPVRPPEPGDVVPDFSFVNQYGRAEHFSKFHGKAVPWHSLGASNFIPQRTFWVSASIPNTTHHQSSRAMARTSLPRRTRILATGSLSPFP